MGIPILLGRSFQAADTATSPRVAVVSQSLARALWPGIDPIGRTLGASATPPTVVGVIPDAVYTSVLERNPHPFYLLPLSQNALLLRPNLAYHDYEGVALDLDERARIVADIGTKRALMLRNHGSLVWGLSAAEVFTIMYFLEQACRQQIAALSAGRDNLIEVPQDVQDKVAPLSGGLGFVGPLVWPGILRRLNRELPGYDT